MPMDKRRTQCDDDDDDDDDDDLGFIAQCKLNITHKQCTYVPHSERKTRIFDNSGKNTSVGGKCVSCAGTQPQEPDDKELRVTGEHVECQSHGGTTSPRGCARLMSHESNLTRL